MEITFKDVGQGDSIILEWADGEKKKVGIIDCNLKGGKNPVLDHIIAKKYHEIEFIILTHPHRDHYSGLSGLFDYLLKENIVVNKMAHTLLHAEKRYWKYFEVSSTDSRILNKLIKQIKILKEKGIIKLMDAVLKGSSFYNEGTISLECLAPSFDEIEEYHRIVKDDADANVKEASSAANLLSTIFRLKVDNYYFLFTSDAEHKAFDSIIQRGEVTFAGQHFLLCQIPHHGSEKNHHIEFWEKIDIVGEPYATISAGQHRLYRHPSFSVISHFQQKGYVVHCTSVINGMEQYIKYLMENILNSTILDMDSELAQEYVKAGDRKYLLIGDKLIFQ